MKINIKAHNISLTPAISQYVEKKIQSLKRFIPSSDTSAKADVEVERTTHHHQVGDVFRAEINLHVGDIHLRAEEIDADLYAAIDRLKDEIHRQLISQKKKRLTMFKRGALRLKNMLKGLTGKSVPSDSSDDSSEHSSNGSFSTFDANKDNA